MKTPKFSFITPTYNRAYILWKTIQSVQNQWMHDWELLIIDDGSTDDTKKLISEFQHDERIRYHFQNNQGPSAARNNGLSHAIGDIVVYLDSDDELYPHFLSTILQSVQNKPEKNFGICNHNRSIELLDKDFKTIAHKIDNSTQSENITLQCFYDWKNKTTSSGVFHRRLTFENKVSWKSGIFIEDLEFIMQLAVLDPNGFIHIPQSLFHYRQKYGSDGLCSQATYEMWAHSFGKIYELHKNDPLMKCPDIYLSRVTKYSDLHEKALRGEERPQVYKYFPELWNMEPSSNGAKDL